jgi:hypothetical protein
MGALHRLHHHHWRSLARHMPHGHHSSGTILNRSDSDAVGTSAAEHHQPTVSHEHVWFRRRKHLQPARCLVLCCGCSPSRARQWGVRFGDAPSVWAGRTACTTPRALCRPTASCTSRCWAATASMPGALPRQAQAATAKVSRLQTCPVLPWHQCLHGMTQHLAVNMWLHAGSSACSKKEHWHFCRLCAPEGSVF